MRYAFGDFEIDLRLCELRRAGTLVRIEPKAFDVLAYLIEQRDRVVSKQELLDALWPDEAVTEWALTYSIGAARRALRDDDARQRIIETIHRRGYRFVAPLEVLEPHVAAATVPPPVEPFIGRQAEIARLGDALARAHEGHGRLVMLVGEPGIGKTRTAEQLMALARERGMGVLVGRCYERGGAPAFWPWVQILRSYVQGCEPKRLREEIGRGGAELAHLVPELTEILPAASLTPGDRERDRFLLFDSVSTLLRAASRTRPLMLLLDDLHWADKPSLLLLELLAQHMRDAALLVIGTYRDTDLRPPHPLLSIAAGLHREPLYERISLTGLDVEEIRLLLAGMQLGSAPDALIRSIARETAGNPFFAKEIYRDVVAAGDVGEAASGRLRMPDSIREVLRRRLARSSKPCRRVLELAAVCGREIDTAVLVRACEGWFDESSETAQQVPSLLAEAEAARIIERQSRSPGARLRFTHPLMREALYDGLRPSVRSALHQRLAAVLEQLRATGAAVPIAELAEHFFHAGFGGADLDKAIAFCHQAGAEATAALAWEDAVLHLSRALQLAQARASDDLSRGELLIELGDAQRRAGDNEAARESFLAAASLARDLGSSEIFGRAVLGFSGWLDTGMLQTFDGSVAVLLEEALGRLEPGDSALRAMLLARLALATYWSDSAAHSRESWSQEALLIARRLGDHAVLAAVLRAHHNALWKPANADDRLLIAAEMVELALAADDAELALRARFSLLRDRLELGQSPELDAEIEIQQQLADELRLPRSRWDVAENRIMVTLLRGDFAAAEQQANEALAVGRIVHPDTANQSFGIWLFIIRREQGRLAELEPAVRELAERSQVQIGWRCALTLLLSELEREAEARALFERFVAERFASVRDDLFWLIAMANLAEASVYLNHGEGAEMLYDLLEPYAERNVMVPPLAYYGPVSHYLGLLATTMGRPLQAAEHFEEALLIEGRLPAPPWRARTAYAYAAMLAGGRLHEQRRSRDLLRTARALSQTLPLPALLAQIERRWPEPRRRSRRRVI